MIIQQLHDDFKMPIYTTDGAAAFDIFAVETKLLMPGKHYDLMLGFSAEIPDGFMGILAPRSGTGSKGIVLRNTVGFLDSDFRDEWQARIVIRAGSEPVQMTTGKRFLQCAIVPIIKPLLVSGVVSKNTKRGEGFNSSGED